MWIDLLAVLACCAAPPQAVDAPERLSVARLELAGPLSALELRAQGVQSRWRGAVQPGERFEVGLALAASADDGASKPELTWEGDGVVRFIGWDREAVERRAATWSSLPAELRSRPAAFARPPRRPRVPPAGVLAALATALAVLAARSRAVLALSVALLGAVLAGWATSAAASSRSPRVIEVDAACERAVAVESEFGMLAGARLDDLRWDSPTRAPSSVGATRGSPDLVLRTPGAWLRRWSGLDVGGRSLGPDVNDWGLLSPVWRRDPEGVWRELGVWPRGVVLSPETGRRGSDPPGWINPAFPAGVHVIVGRWTDAPQAGDGRETWLRWAGR